MKQSCPVHLFSMFQNSPKTTTSPIGMKPFAPVEDFAKASHKIIHEGNLEEM